MDELAGLPGESGASADAPAASGMDIEARLAALEAGYEERIKGFQRLLANRDQEKSALERELKELKTADLSEDERVQLTLAELQEEKDRLETELELVKLGSKYQDEMPLYQKLLGAQTAEEQLEFLRSLRSSGAAPAGKAPAESSDLDLNNPRQSAPAGMILPDGTMMTDELAERILKGAR